MRKIKKLNILAFVGALCLASCLKDGLPEYENWDQNMVNNVYVEYRFESDEIFQGQPVVAYQRLNVTQEIDSVNNKVSLKITVPASSGAFTEEQRTKVAQNHLWIYMDVSTAATVSPVGDTPKLGDPTDLTVPQTYQVAAANGAKRTWTVQVTSFEK